MKRFVLLFALAGCAPVDEGLSQPIDGELVSFGNGGSITGGGMFVTISPNDVLVTTWNTGDTHGPKKEWEKLPDGTFDTIQAIALREIKKLEGQVFPNNCMDAGTDRIFVRDAAGTDHEARSICPGTAVEIAQTFLGAELSRLRFTGQDDLQ